MRYSAIGLGLLAALFFGMATPVSKLLLRDVNAFELAGLLYLGAAIGVLPLIISSSRKRRTIPPKSRQLSHGIKIMGAIVCGGFLGPVFLLLGLNVAHAASVAIWLNMELVSTAVLGVVLFNDHLDRNGWIGVGLTLCAGIVMTMSEGSSGGLAALLVTAACVCWGFDNHFTALIDSLPPSHITLLKGLVAGTVNIAIGFSISDGLPTFTLVAMALLLGAISYGLSIVLYVASAQYLGATRSQIVFSTAPFFGVALSVVILNESFTLMHVVAMSFIGAGIYFSNRLQHHHPHEHMAVVHTHVHRHDDDHHDDHHDIDDPSQPHTHVHNHAHTEHTHDHFPDLHHRHQHRDEEKKR